MKSNGQLVLKLPLGHMTQAAALDEAEQFLGKIGGVIAGAFQGLRHQHGAGAVLHVFSCASDMPQKKRLVDAVDFAVGAKHGVRRLKVAVRKSVPHVLQHLLQNVQHLHQVLSVSFRQCLLQTVRALRDSPEQITNAFEICAETQTGEQFTRFRFGNLRDGGRQLLVNLLLEAI